MWQDGLVKPQVENVINIKEKRMITVNAMGDACPIPVVKTKNAIKELKTGKVTPIEYNKKCEEIRKNHNKAVSDINEEYDELMRELRTKYPSYWGYDWD